MLFPEKLKKAVQYVAFKCDPYDLGNVRLNKILWKSDVFMHMKRGESITGWRYKKKPYGPMVDGYHLLLSELEDQGIISRNYDFKGKREICLISADTCDLNNLSEEERNILDSFIDYVTNQHTAQSISEESHDSFYDLTQDDGIIPLGPIRIEPSEGDIQWARQVIDEYDQVQT